jgi:hypothetical protein
MHQTKEWLDALVLAYWTDAKPSAQAQTIAQCLKALPTSPMQHTHRPCGYVFCRGDIAWNCRTCQTDATCVICDECFRNSNHEGHEVYFHRTTPGGCCDCGDVEAWCLEGCCHAHRPTEPATPTAVVLLEQYDPMEAVRSSQRGYQEALETLQKSDLPPRLLAALGVVIGAAVQCLLTTVDSSGISADYVQWKWRWADEAAKVHNGVVHNQEYCVKSGPFVSPTAFLGDNAQTLPEGYRLTLRLHNDDVHTYDEVIDALHDGDPITSIESLVPMRDEATQMTHHVDADGQVAVVTYASIPAALQGFRKLKSRGLHCAVVSTAQLQSETRAKLAANWLSDIAAAHPVAAALVIHALVQVHNDHDLGGYRVWLEPRCIPIWAGLDQTNLEAARHRRCEAFPPHLASSYVSFEEAELLHGMALTIRQQALVNLTGTDPSCYATVPYRLPSERYRKSPHALWGTLQSFYSDPVPASSKHPLLYRLVSEHYDASFEKINNHLTESVFVVDTDLRKQQEADRITSSVYPHKLPGLHIVSGVGTMRIEDVDVRRPPLPSPMELRHLLATSSFRVPISPVLLLILLDPYPTKQLRGAFHALFLSLLTDSRFKCRFAGALGVAYRPLTTLFCAGVGTEADTPLHFTVQIFTAGSLVRALLNAPATEKLLASDNEALDEFREASIGIFTSPIAHTIVRCIHTNLLGATKEVNMILKTTNPDDDETSTITPQNDGLLPALTYTAGEHPLLTPLPAAPDDGFLDSRSTRHKRLPHLLRDLEYVIETPGTATRLLLPRLFPVYQGPALSHRGEVALAFPVIFARMLRLAQGMDPQKRKISGGHVEFEQNRWLEAFGLSLNFAGTRDALAESPAASIILLEGNSNDVNANAMQTENVREALGNMVSALLREMKHWLYREGLLETGLPVPAGGMHGAMDLVQVETLQRSTLHVQENHAAILDGPSWLTPKPLALSCATGVKMTEHQLSVIENAIRGETARWSQSKAESSYSSVSGALMGDCLRVPHSPLGGDSLSFHLPLHRALAKTVRSICSLSVPEAVRSSNARLWWRIPVLDDDQVVVGSDVSYYQHPLVPLIRTTLRSSNCRVVWTAGPDCSPQEAQKRRSRSRNVSANIAVAKVIHSIADHPIRCLAAAQQIERHIWARNGTPVAGMSMNYSTAPLCKSFRDLDLLLVQLSAAGMSVGLGARRVFALLLNRFNLDGYLCDPEKRVSSPILPTVASPLGSMSVWVNPPRLQDPDHAELLSECFFSTLCVLVTELPPPPPIFARDDTCLRLSIRRELLHALAAEPRSRSEAMSAALVGIRDDSDMHSGLGSNGLFKEAFADVLNEIAKQKNQSSLRASSGPPAYELKPECCDEYDPSFYHLRRQEHQHAMDVIARLRKQKWNSKDISESYCLPLVGPPPKAHPRFLPCRLLLHLPMMDAAIRRSLLFALTGGSWLPPPEPAQKQDSSLVSDNAISLPSDSGAPQRNLSRGQSLPSNYLKRTNSDDGHPTFSKEVVATSSISFLEVLQLLTLQVHTLEECASLHRTLPDIDEEARSLSYGLSINSYLSRLMRVPESLNDVWALQPYPQGPLPSKGSGQNRGSILGLLIALYEHRADHGSVKDADGGDDDGHGGARTLSSNGLKWLLRFLNSLVDGAPSVKAATQSATTGVPVGSAQSTPIKADTSSWTIDKDIRNVTKNMLSNLPDLWPKVRDKFAAVDDSAGKSKEAGKAAQKRIMEMMKRKQLSFAATIAPSNKTLDKGDNDNETELCIICRCDDADGENNGPLGYLGHVQRSRVAQLRFQNENANTEGPSAHLLKRYRVVGHMGCKVRNCCYWILYA